MESKNILLSNENITETILSLQNIVGKNVSETCESRCKVSDVIQEIAETNTKDSEKRIDLFYKGGRVTSIYLNAVIFIRGNTIIVKQRSPYDINKNYGFTIEISTDLSIGESVKKYLESKGMFPTQAEDVLNIMMKHPANDSLSSRWIEKTDSYPDMLMKIIYMDANRTALIYIDENCPQAWFRPMFLTLKEQEAFIKDKSENGSVLEKELFTNVQKQRTKGEILDGRISFITKGKIDNLDELILNCKDQSTAYLALDTAGHYINFGDRKLIFDWNDSVADFENRDGHLVVHHKKYNFDPEMLCECGGDPLEVNNVSVDEFIELLCKGDFNYDPTEEETAIIRVENNMETDDEYQYDIISFELWYKVDANSETISNIKLWYDFDKLESHPTGFLALDNKNTESV